MTKGKDRNEGEKAGETSESPTERDRTPESARAIPVPPRRNARAAIGFNRMGSRKTRYVN